MMKKMKKRILSAVLCLSLVSPSYADQKAFIFSSFGDASAKDQIDKNVTWRNTAMTYQALRNLGIQKEDIFIFYNKKQPDKADNDIRLKTEMDAQPLWEGTYEKLDTVFREKTKGLTSLDEIILTTNTHGEDDGTLYPSYDKPISGLTLSRLLATTPARSIAFYHACYVETVLARSHAKNTVFVAVTDKNHLSWSDRQYSTTADFFEAFTISTADTDENGGISFEEAAAYAAEKWKRYNRTFLEQYILTTYQFPLGEEYENREAFARSLSCIPIVKRGVHVSKDWTLRKQ